MRIHITAIFPEIHSELRDLYERLDIGYTKEDATKDVPPELKEEWDRMIDRAGRLEKLIAVLARQGQQITSETELEIEDDAGNPIIMQISRQRFKAQKWGYTWRLYLLSR